jgi:hypothetical protein
VGRFHGPFATHVAVIVFPDGRVQCRGWGLRVDAEAALERALRTEGGLLHAEVHETEPDVGRTGQRLKHRLPPRWFGVKASEANGEAGRGGPAPRTRAVKPTPPAHSRGSR